ncbi:helix-turn-helix transcriptional regulator [Aureimonas sp. AU40]|uniref:helix-turn-helix transcriptional regulator n=1 Tax=Aureimonas sp. AU40 TaxID=1637747 RepID=UPI0007812E9B|nr:helix-turn-helix transcriptional regulator [Aureimonas sp. AU40]
MVDEQNDAVDEAIADAVRKPDQKWFSDRIRDRNLTQRALAKLLEMDPSSLSLLLHGKRRMRVEQAAEIARLLNVPVEDVMRRAGADVLGSSERNSIPLVGWIDADGVAKIDWTKSDHRVDFDTDLPPTAAAIQYRTAQTKADMFDGWLAAILPPRAPEEGAMIDRMCVVGLKGGGTLLRRVRRGYTPGRYTLISVFVDPIHDAELAWFSPVLFIRPV